MTLTNPAEAREALDVKFELVGANNLKAEKVELSLTHTHSLSHSHTFSLSISLFLTHTHTLPLYPSIPPFLLPLSQ